MNIQTLVVTTDQNDDTLPERMNLQTPAIIGNQCGREEVAETEYEGKRIQWVSTATRGVGVNRNLVLLRASGDICVLADDDMTFLPGYEAVVEEWFRRLPQADLLIFNLEGGKKRYIHKKVKRIHRLNYGKFGAARLAFRRDALRRSGVMFHTMFGGGCQYSCGEDTLFLRDCLDKGLRIYGVPASIARIEDGASTWFRGYTDKYFFDKGVLYCLLNNHLCRLHAVVHCIRYRKKYGQYGWQKAVKQMMKGIDSLKCVRK